MKKRIFAGLTLVLTVLLSFGLLAAEKSAAPAKRNKKAAAAIATLLPPELHRSLNLVPEDAVAAGFVNAEAIVRGKLFPEMMKAAGKDLDTLITTMGGKKENADYCTVFYVRMTPPPAAAANPAEPANPAQMMPSIEAGGVLVYKREETARSCFAKIDEDIRKGLAEADPKAAEDVKVEKIKIGERDAIRISMQSQKLTIISIVAGKNIIQFRIFFNTEPVLELIPARGEVTPLAAALNLKSAIAVALDGARLRALAGETMDSPELKAVHRIACAVTEKKNGLSVVGRIASDLDGVQLLQPKITEAINSMKEDPMMGIIASKTTVSVQDATNIVVRAFIPAKLILQNLQLYKDMNDAAAKAPAEPAAAPAAAPAK